MFMRLSVLRQPSRPESGILILSKTGACDTSKAFGTHRSTGTKIGDFVKRPLWLTNLWFSSEIGSTKLIAARFSSGNSPRALLLRSTARRSSPYTTLCDVCSDPTSSNAKYAAANGDRVQGRKSEVLAHRP